MQKWIDDYMNVPWWYWIVRLVGVILGLLAGAIIVNHMTT